jgi:glycosyltransferase involved in cell wall biosynthesis
MHGIAAATVAIAIIGRIVPVKNYALFVEVVAKIVADVNLARQIKFFVIGDGAEKMNVQSALDELGIHWSNDGAQNNTNSVIFTSWIPDVAQALHAMDIVVLTSHNEGTPLSLIEAQFCGKPVVATNVGGVKDTLLDGESGFLVPPGNADAFAEKLVLLMKDEALRNRMGKKAADFATNKFSKEKETSSFRHLYQHCSK